MSAEPSPAFGFNGKAGTFATVGFGEAIFGMRTFAVARGDDRCRRHSGHS